MKGQIVESVDGERAAESAAPPRVAHALTPDSHQIPSLDGMRGIAVLIVMASHFQFAIRPEANLPFVKAVAAQGWAGVDMFFVLSGFLITGILLNTRAASNYFASFYARRVLRIFPIYYATLIFMFWLASALPIVSPDIPVAAERPYYFLFLENWIAVWKGSWPPNSLGHFWSLAVEEQYYLVWPLIVLILARRTVKGLAISLAIVAVVLRTYWLFAFGFSQGAFLSTITRSDGLLLGSACAVFYAERKSLDLRLAGRWIVIPLILLLAIGVRFGATSSIYLTSAISLLAISFSALILYLAFSDGRANALQEFFCNSALRRVGRYSYGMYVYHVPVLSIAQFLLFHRLAISVQANPVVILAYTAGLAVTTYLVAMISYEMLERRILGLKRYFKAAKPLAIDRTSAAAALD